MTGRINSVVPGLMLALIALPACEQRPLESKTEMVNPKGPPTIDAGFFKPLSVTLNDQDEPTVTGPDREAFKSNCLSCHSADMILNQPGLSKQTWQSEVAKMRKVYKAPIADTDVPAIIAYLTSIKPGA
jgi:hypothetical protein